MAEEEKKIPEKDVVTVTKVDGGDAEGKKPDSDDDSISPEQKLIKELEGKLSESQKRAAEAESARDSERMQKDTARKEATTEAEKRIIAQENEIKSTVNAAKSSFESAQKEWDDAYDAGDKQKLRAAQEKLNDAQMQLRGAEFNEQRFKTWKETSKPAAPSEELYAVKTGTGGNINVPKRTLDWINRHPKFKTDPEYAEAVYAADGIAKSRGIEMYSDAHHNFIESQLKKQGFESDGEDDPEEKPKEPAKKSEKQSSSTAAPVGGSTGSTSNANNKKVFTLTPEMRRAAQIAFPDEYKKSPDEAEKKYAKYQLEMREKKAKGEQ